MPVRPNDVASGGGAYIDVLPEGADVAEWCAAELDERKPSAVIFIEKLGSDADGVMKTSTGLHLDIPDFSPLAELASQRGIVSIGIGDAGNEIGGGRIFDVVNEVQSGNIATAAKTDHWIIASISNWGASALQACLAYLLRRQDVMHGPVIERRILNAALDANGYEALFCSRQDLVDGVAGETSVSYAQVLAEIVRLNLAEHDLGPAH